MARGVNWDRSVGEKITREMMEEEMEPLWVWWPPSEDTPDLSDRRLAEVEGLLDQVLELEEEP